MLSDDRRYPRAYLRRKVVNKDSCHAGQKAYEADDLCSTT